MAVKQDEPLRDGNYYWVHCSWGGIEIALRIDGGWVFAGRDGAFNDGEAYPVSRAIREPRAP